VALKRILLVEEDVAGRAIFSSTLSSKGYEVAAVADGAKILDFVDRLNPDLIVLAPETPNTDVVGLIRTLRTRPETAFLPVIFLARREEIEERIQGYKLAADDFLPKPVESRELDVHVAVALKVREKTESAFRPQALNADFSSPNLLTAFRGTLDQIGLPTILTLLEMERKTGMLVLILEPENEKVRLFLHEGRLIRAQYDRKAEPRNAALVYELLARPRGKFEFRNVLVDPRDEIRTSTALLLLEGARRIDEERRGR
jgi:DNA-binding response OmpR family regulator